MISYFTQTLILRYELLHFLGKVSVTLLQWSLVNFLIMATAVVELICHFYLTSLPDVLIHDQMLKSALMDEDVPCGACFTVITYLCAICGNSSDTDTYSYRSCHMRPNSYNSTKGGGRGKGKTGQPTEKSNSEPLQDASPLPKEEITPGVCQETYYSTGEGDQKVSDGQINYDIVQGLSELFELESDEHDEEIFAQRQRGDHKHEHSQDREVPLRDVSDGCSEGIVSGGEFSCHSVGHSVHRQA